MATIVPATTLTNELKNDTTGKTKLIQPIAEANNVQEQPGEAE
jgi:hypothetical protein